MAVVQNCLPGDPLLIDKIVYELKSQGIFDQFRKECIADVDTKPAYQNLRQRVEGSVSGFLNKQKWSPDMNKNQLREMLRKNIYESGFLETGVERIVDQVVNPKINSVFLPKVTEVVYKFLGIEKKSADDKGLSMKPSSNNDTLLPTDLEAVSPESEKRFNTSNNSSQNLDDSKIDEDESPPFEPLEEKPIYTIAPEENSMDSHLSGFSGLMSHDSNHSQEVSKTTQMEVSNQDSTISKQSSEGRLSIVMSDDNDTKMEISEDSLQQKPHKTKTFNFQSEITNNTSSGKKTDNKPEEKSSKSSRNKDDKHKSKHDKDGKKDDKDSSRKSEKERKEHKHSSSKDKDKSKDKDRDRRDSSKSGRSDKSKSSSRHSTSSRDNKDKDKTSSSKKESSSSSSKERSKSSSSSSKHKDDKTKHSSSSKHESRSDKHKKDEKHHKSDRHSSSSSKNRDKKDPKKEKKENKDDHFSSKKRTDRRSTDRDSNDGHSGLKSSSSSFDSYSSSQTQGKNQESSNSNSNNGSGGDSNSDCIEGVINMAPLKLIKPKFASNIHEARRLMKIRKQIKLLEKQNLLNAAKLITQKLIENKRRSIENEKKNYHENEKKNHHENEKKNHCKSPEIKRKDPSPPPLSPPLKSSIVSAATWDALEAKLHQSINYTTRYDGLENDDEQEIVIQNKDDCLYLKNDIDGKVQRYRKFASEYIANLENSIEGICPQSLIKKDIALQDRDKDDNINKGVKRKFVDYSSDLKNNNKRFNTHHIEVHENFSLPLSPAESDNSIDKKSDVSDSSDKALKKIEGDLVVKRTNRGALNNQRYSSEELYKPRLVFGSSRRRKGRNVGLD